MRRKNCLIFKVDFEKTCDSVCWKFLFYMMRMMIFCEMWISWTKGGLVSSSILILVNTVVLRKSLDYEED